VSQTLCVGSQKHSEKLKTHNTGGRREEFEERRIEFFLASIYKGGGGSLLSSE
jgi:hypothetical protein